MGRLVMSFIVFERDPFIRCDILETLAANFPGVQVSAYSALEELAEKAAGVLQPCVAVLSSNRKELESLLGILRAKTQDISFVVISDDTAESDGSTGVFHQVSRPFNSEMLLRAVRSALSGQQ